MISQPKKVYIAMSGGVDSSVAAALLKKQGFEVVGVFMKPYQPGLTKSNVISVDNRLAMSVIHSDIRCRWQRDREDAMKVASRLSIPLLTWDFSKEYKKQVTDYMIREYRAGRTPNPDVMCNKEIKFGLFLEKALKEGADYIATGHYVRTRLEGGARRGKIGTRPRHSFSLYVAKDKNKDQSYFLWTLTQKQLKYCLFPIGDYIKSEVRGMAKKFGLSTAGKKDSQGVCFIGPLDIKGFLQKYIKSKKGKILDVKNNLVGYHDGVFYYTIGQRHGLNITNGKGPYFVVKKDLKKNIIYVGKEGSLKEKTAEITDINWISGNQRQFPIKVDVRIRYRSKSEKATLSKNSGLKFKNLTRAITPGQSAVFYRGKELLGGGIIN